MSRYKICLVVSFFIIGLGGCSSKSTSDTAESSFKSEALTDCTKNGNPCGVTIDDVSRGPGNDDNIVLKAHGCKGGSPGTPWACVGQASVSLPAAEGNLPSQFSLEDGDKTLIWAKDGVRIKIRALGGIDGKWATGTHGLQGYEYTIVNPQPKCVLPGRCPSGSCRFSWADPSVMSVCHVLCLSCAGGNLLNKSVDCPVGTDISLLDENSPGKAYLGCSKP